MATQTSNFSFTKPAVNSATDADLWGGQLNTNWDDADGYLAKTTSSKTNNFNVGTDEFNYTYLIDASSNTVTATLPAAADVFNGFTVRFKATDITNTVTLDGNSSETIDGATTVTIDDTDRTLELVCDGSNWHITSMYQKNNLTINEQTGATYTFVLSDATNTIVQGNRATAQTFTVPPNSSVAYPVGSVIPVYQDGAGQVTIAQGSGVTIRTAETLKIRGQYSSAALLKIATDEWLLIGDLEAA